MVRATLVRGHVVRATLVRATLARATLLRATRARSEAMPRLGRPLARGDAGATKSAVSEAEASEAEEPWTDARSGPE